MQSFVGHGDSINEIRTQMLKPSLVLSASKVSIMSFVLVYFFSDLNIFSFVLLNDNMSKLWDRMNQFGFGMSILEYAF